MKLKHKITQQKKQGVLEKSLPRIVIFLYSWAIIAVEAIVHLKKHVLHYKAIDYAIFAFKNCMRSTESYKVFFLLQLCIPEEIFAYG